eukprot:s792_g24.t1
MGNGYESIISSSPLLGLAALESHLSKRAKTSTARADAEEAKKKWALELSKLMVEAKLSAVGSFEGLPNQNAAWVRAFGSRRSKTLRNRAKAWQKVREWLIVTTGEPWPSTVGIMLQYLEERNEDYVLTSRQVVHRVQKDVCRFILEGVPGPGLASEPAVDVMIGPQMQTEPEPQEDDELPEAPYFITISRKSFFRRLHVSKSCAVRQERCLVTQPVYSLSKDVADAVCKLCRPKLKAENQAPSSSSSTDSSS